VESWRLPFAVRIRGRLVGIQQLGGRRFLASHAVATSSWLAAEAQGAGIRTEMREEVLALAFDYLGARVAVSGAFGWNVASIGVSEKLGYRRTGVDLVDTANGRREEIRFELGLSEWQLRSARRLTVSGLDACLDLFGLTPARVVGAMS
jgi:RimJ/RimL family protein N-acetyltransferase